MSHWIFGAHIETLQEKIQSYFGWLEDRGIKYPTLTFATPDENLTSAPGSDQPDAEVSERNGVAFWTPLKKQPYLLELEHQSQGIFFACVQNEFEKEKDFLLKVKSAIENHTKNSWSLCILPESEQVKQQVLEVISSFSQVSCVFLGPQIGNHFSESWQEDVTQCFSFQDQFQGDSLAFDYLLTYATESFLTQPGLKRDLWSQLLEFTASK